MAASGKDAVARLHIKVIYLCIICLVAGLFSGVWLCFREVSKLKAEFEGKIVSKGVAEFALDPTKPGREQVAYYHEDDLVDRNRILVDNEPHSRKKRRAKRRPKDLGSGGAPDDLVWMNSYSRVPLHAIQKFCEESKEYCTEGPAESIQGLKGEPGIPGPKGDNGSPGLLGATGPKGDNGTRGESGEPGMDGAAGPPGRPGLPGAMGEMGLPGMIGPTGDRGFNGSDGQPGPMGPPGFNGTEGEKGRRGKRGKVGPKGDKGDSGALGDGSLGNCSCPPGPVGPPGPMVEGPPGPPGPQGHIGNPGPTGLPGLKGQKGDQGEAGRGFTTTPVPTTTELITTPEPTVKPRIEECQIKQVGKPMFIRYTTRYWGAWMQDPYPANTLLQGHYWVTEHFTGQILSEYSSLNDFKQNKVAKTYTLDYVYFGTGHVVYKSAFYYHHEGHNEIIKFDLQKEQVMHRKRIRHASYQRKEFVYSIEYNFFDFAIDKNGLWVIYGHKRLEDVLLVSKLDHVNLEVDKTWQVEVSHRNFGNGFITCGVLYLINSTTQASSKIDFAYDLYEQMKMNVSIPFTNPFQLNNMVSYNPVSKKINSWDKGNQLTYPLLI